MAVFKQELNWSTYQDTQLKVLRSIESSLSQSFRIGTSLEDSLEKISKSIGIISHATEVSAQNIALMTKEWTGQSVEYARQMEEAGKSVSHVTQQLRGASDDVNKFSDDVGSAGSSFVGSIGDFVSSITSHIGSLQGAFNKVDEFSALSNRMIYLSGMSGDAVRDFKADIMSTVADLNVATGSAFSALESYNKVISTSQGITSDLDAIAELARPLLLTTETLDVNINTVADLFNKFYVRYNFSSLHMETALEEIRGNTAGNSANAEATFEAINQLEGIIGRIAGNDNEMRLSMIEQISQMTSHAESMGIDSKYFAQWMYDIYAGDAQNNKELLAILSSAGVDLVEAEKRLSEQGDVIGLYGDLQTGLSNLIENTQMLEMFNKKTATENFGLDYDFVMDFANAVSSENYQALHDFLETVAPDNSLEELVDDKYVSAADKTNHWLELIYSKLASIQELNPLGFGFSDAAAVTLLAKNFLPESAGNLLSASSLRSAGLSSALDGAMTTPGALSNASLGLGKVAGLGGGLGGAAMIAGGVTAGAGLAIDGISGLASPDASTTSKVFSGIETAGGIGGAAALIGLGVTNPVGWIALGVGAAALAAKKIHESVTPLSGAAETVELEFENLRESFYDEQTRRSAQLDALENSISSTNDLSEAIKTAKDSGLLPLENVTIDSREALLEMIASVRDTTTELINLQDAAFNAAEEIVKEDAKKQDAQIEKEIFTKISEYMGDDGVLKKGDQGYDLTKQVFTQIANSISDETARNEALADVEKIFKNEKLSESELKFLTDTGGSGRALFSGELDRKDNAFRQVGDFETKNAALGLLGLSGYDMSSMESVEQLTSIYSSWMNATKAAEKAKFADQYEEIFSELSPSLQDVYLEQAKALGIESYDVGTNYIEQDKIAILHEGEAVVPKKYNPAANSAEFKELAEQLSQERRKTAEDSRVSQEYMRSFIDELVEIRQFLSEWKEDTARREKISEAKQKYGAGRAFISSYLRDMG